MGRPTPGLEGLGSAVRPVLRRHGVRRSAPEIGSDRMLLSAVARKLAESDRAQLQRKLLGRSSISFRLPRGIRRGISANCCALRREGLARHAVSLFSKRQIKLQATRLVAWFIAVAARRAGQLSRLLGAAIFRRGVPCGNPASGERREAGLSL